MAADARVFIGIGSNLGDRAAHVGFATTRLSRLPRTRLLRISPWYRSKAVGPGAQGDYLNGVAELRSALLPYTLLQALHDIERAAGRIRAERWGSRTLDLDLLLHGQTCVEMPRLQLPHPRLAERNFVVFPLSDLAPSLMLPGGQRLQSLRARMSDRDLERLDSSTGAHDGAA